MWWIVAGILTVAGWWGTLPKEIHPELLPYVELFVEDANRYGHDIVLDDIHYVGYDRLIPGVAGVGAFSRAMVDVDVDYEPAIMLVLYHELGHALFSCMHSDNTGDIMYGGGVYSKITHWDNLVESFFTTNWENNRCLEL